MEARLPEAVEPVEGWTRNPVAADIARLSEQAMEARLPEAVEPVERWRRRPVAGLKQANSPGILSPFCSSGSLEAVPL